ncbi:membrane protein [Spirochaetia bacterium]|nr:membrane protein [Spirochaetia bacterium]
MWIIFAVLSAVFAALTSILAKVGIDGVNSNLATAVRTAVVLVLAWGIVFATGAHQGLPAVSRKSLVFLVLSGLATGLSWLCYYRAIQMDKVSRVAPIDKFSIVLTLIAAFIFLKEPLTPKTIIGAVCISVGTLVILL